MSWLFALLLVGAPVQSATASPCEIALEMKTEFGRLAAVAARNSILSLSQIEQLLSADSTRVFKEIPATPDNLPWIKGMIKAWDQSSLSDRRADLERIKLQGSQDQDAQRSAKQETRLIFAPKLVHDEPLAVSNVYHANLRWVENEGRPHLFAVAQNRRPNLTPVHGTFSGGAVSTIYSAQLERLEGGPRGGLFINRPGSSPRLVIHSADGAQVLNLPSLTIAASQKFISHGVAFHPFQFSTGPVRYLTRLNDGVWIGVHETSERLEWSSLKTATSNSQELWFLALNQFDVPELVRYDGIKFESEVFPHAYQQPALVLDASGNLILHSHGPGSRHALYIRSKNGSMQTHLYDSPAVGDEIQLNQDGNPTLLLIDRNRFRLIEIIDGKPIETHFTLNLPNLTDFTSYSAARLASGDRYIALGQHLSTEIYDMKSGTFLGRLPLPVWSKNGLATFVDREGHVFLAGMSKDRLEIYSLMNEAKP